MDLALNNRQRLICQKTQKTKPNHQICKYLKNLFFLTSDKRMYDKFISPYTPFFTALELSLVQTLKNVTNFT